LTACAESEDKTLSKGEEKTNGVLHALKKVPTQRWVAVGILAVLVIVISIGNPLFLKWTNINGILQQVAATGIVALGAMVVIISGGIDFTSGNGLAMAGVFAGVMYFKAGENIYVLILAAMAAGAVLGFANGFLVTKCNLKPFVATLAMMAFTQGLTLLISEGQLAFLNHPATFVIGGGNLFGIFSVPFTMFLGMCLITWVMLNRMKMGTYIYAMGGNEEATRYVGVNIVKYKWLVYVFGGLCTGIASLIAICRVGQISANIDGTFLMDGISAAIIGGTSPAGGKGAVSGTILGVLILGVVSNALTFLQVATTAQTAVKGAIILFAIIIDALFAMNQKD
jgi:ribose/xylose/arabinose/galactoside ABC-type transport system permease subunit